MTGETKWWAEDPYWSNALSEIIKSREDGGRFIKIDLSKIDETLSNGDGPAFRLLEAMKSVTEHEFHDGYRGAPRLVLALLWKLQELSENR